MRPVFFVVASFLISPAVFAATSQPATTQSAEEQLAIHKAQEKKEYLDALNATAELKLPTGQISDIFVLKIDAGQIVVNPLLGATDGQMHCTVKGLPSPCSVSIFSERQIPGAPVNGLQFAHRDFSSDREIFRHTMLFAHPGAVQLSMDLDGVVRSKSVSLIEDLRGEDADNAVRLNAQVLDAASDEMIAEYKRAAPTFRELRQRYPREVQEFVVPILRDLQAQAILAPDARVARQVFEGESRPDPELSKKIDAALAKFDSDKFQEREQASKDLEALGEPAARALKHADRHGWSIDRGTGVDTFLAEHKAVSSDEIGKLRSDPIFLLDCMYSEEAAIRTSASEAIEKLAGVKIDPGADASVRDASIDLVYAKVFPPLATQPATQP